ncbi:MAG: hypothetical protein K0S56_626 [Microvirga sp.]|jgi:glycine/D-amino acid oxidase-like deaminating enzyme|nr:hypothetical protein [Microvirga sp.]
MKAIVVGAGIVGSSVAYRLAQAGASVTLIEERRVGGGTSGVSFAWVNACEKLTSKPYYDLNFAGREAHAQILEEFSDANWYHRPGVIQWQGAQSEAGGTDGSDPFQKLKLLQEWGYPAESLSHDDLQKLEPELNPDVVGNASVIFYPNDGWCDAVVYAGSVIGGAIERYGLTLVTGKVVGLQAHRGRCEGVTLHDGTTHEADVVVNCSGRWSNDVAEKSAYQIPLAPTVGLIAYTQAAGVKLKRALRTPLVNMRPDGGGRFMLRSNELDKLVAAGSDAVPLHPQAQDLLRRAKQVLPMLGPIEVEAVRIAIRPVPRDSYSAVGPVPDLSGYYVVVTHSGVTLGPFLGQAVTDEIVHGTKRPELSEFRPSRFFN